ncbi:MAG: hypothetical protein WCI47_01855 [bacterium]
MNQRGWEDLVDLIDQKFELKNHKKTTEPLPDNPRYNRLVDSIWFDKKGESYRVDRVTQPGIANTKSHYAHRGTASRVEHEYSSDDTVSHVTFYRQNESGEWIETIPEGLLG